MPGSRPAMLGRPSLQRRFALGMLGYMGLLSIVVLAFGWMVNERAEALVWRSLLETEMEYFARHADDEEWRPRDSDLLEFFVAAPDPTLPAALAELRPGLHDEVAVDDRQIVALVRDTNGQRLLLALDITAFERSERELALTLLFSSLAVVLLLWLGVMWGLGRLLRPLRELGPHIGLVVTPHGGQT